MLRKIVRLAVLVAVLAVAAAYLLPAEVEVRRSIHIVAPPEAVHAVIAEPRTWPDWTAWDRQRDPTAEYKFFGPASGVGAGYEWRGEEFGEGRLTLTASDPATGIEFDLEFDGGKYHSQGALRLATEADGTEATWVYRADLGLNPVSRYYGLFTDATLGPDLETGLRRLKEKVEASPTAPDGGEGEEEAD